MSADGHEIEAKFRLRNVAALRNALTRHGATFDSHVLERNTILDDADRRLLAAGCGLRVRSAQPADGAALPKVTLTYKGPKRTDAELVAAAVRAREELETTAGNETALLAILGRLGLQPVLIYEKRRETWHAPAAEIVIDELPQLGWFVEIEADSAATIATLRDALGLDAADAIPDSYVAMTAEHGTPDTAGVRALRF
jgi:predicted adenylyl cyclase CyaB